MSGLIGYCQGFAHEVVLREVGYILFHFRLGFLILFCVDQMQDKGFARSSVERVEGDCFSGEFDGLFCVSLSIGDVG